MTWLTRRPAVPAGTAGRVTGLVHPRSYNHVAMPFYEYQCSACGAEVEVLQKITDAPLKKCPECGRNQLQKLVSAPVFRLKGSGWYETDFKKDGDKKRNLADKGDGGSGSSGSSASSSSNATATS